MSNRSQKTDGETEWRTYIGISQKIERGREEKIMSRDVSNRYLRTDEETER